MKTKNQTPFAFGAKITSRRPSQLEMTLIVRGRFRLRPDEPVTPLGVPPGADPAPIEAVLEQGALSGDLFADDDEERAGELVQASDFADFKVCAEVLLRGSCHAPGRRLVTECPVRSSVGPWSKTLRVVGRRVWTEKLVGQAISDPAPFLKMPIVWANAFGGPEHPENPVGRGLGTPELPTVELPDAPVRSRTSRPAPAGFGPINPAWPQRRGKVGKEYGASYRKTRAPFYAEDFDWSYFGAAPVDQQLPGYLRGDEELSFQNLHPEAASFSARLPGLRLRAFVKDRDQRFTDTSPWRWTCAPGGSRGRRAHPHLARPRAGEGGRPHRREDGADRVGAALGPTPARRPLPRDHSRAFEADPQELDKYLSPEAKRRAHRREGAGAP